MKARVHFGGLKTWYVDIELREGNVLSIRGNMRGACGQCLDRMLERLSDDKLFVKIHTLWKNYHLNNMHAGTPAQEQAIEKWELQGNEYNYTKACEYLKSIGLYEDPNHDNYMYGHGWLKEEIPEEDLELIKSIIRTFQ